ncbi:HNH endonuclease [Filimonas lacunae]|uniref:HNH endonuclease n=1 Tax=Filimonas lacunae TaxID=477680 RepID=A0A173MH11_9BACT|nr:HNH endonuclease [Filimonas lacunae]BAV06708.1 hypothetical protein FLA_2728 [Filimonas lacunae]SIT34816.1 HNH endonuclease [Filimonas lacunae]
MSTVCVPPGFEEHAKLFFRIYDLESSHTCPEMKMTGLKPKTSRRCRFCGNSYSPNTKFRKDAHLFPNLLGNRYLVSDFECDRCNSTFSKYENDLANFLGASRVLNDVKGKEKIKFVSPEKSLRAEKTNLSNIQEGILPEGLLFDRDNISDQTFTFDKNTGQAKITYTKPSYRPINVYKIFLKMALSCIKEEDTKYFKRTLEILMTKELDGSIESLCTMGVYTQHIAGGYPAPIGFLYRRKDTTSFIYPAYVFALYFQNYIYQMFIPYCIFDLPLYFKSAIPYIWSPPVFSTEVEIPKITYSPINLGRTDMVKGEKHSVNFKVSQDELTNIVRYDPATKTTEASQLDLENAKGIFFIDENARINIPKE